MPLCEPSVRAADDPVGILLAAGYGSRFDPSGANSKLLAMLPGGNLVAIEAAQRLLRAVPQVYAVVRPDQDGLARALAQAGCIVMPAEQAALGMGASLAAGVAASVNAAGWIVALADMPGIDPATISAVSAAVVGGASLVAPFHQGQRGHPVGFGRQHLPTLLALNGDAGPRALFVTGEYVRLDVDDPGILYDIDVPADLVRSALKP